MNSSKTKTRANELDLNLVSTNQGWTLCKGMDLLSGSHFKTLAQVNESLDRKEQVQAENEARFNDFINCDC